jgi:amino acid transporter
MGGRTALESNGPPNNGDDSRSVVRLQRRRGANGSEPAVAEPEQYETIRGSKPGSRFLRLMRKGDQKLVRVGEGSFEATRVANVPTTSIGRLWANVRGVVIGRALASSELGHERLSKKMALAIFSSDALSSSAYATEEILLVLIIAGAASTVYSIPIALSIGVLCAIVVASYRQTIRAYPNGGGAYVVANENLSFGAGLFAGSALLVDYIMTVAVSTAAGVAAITSAIPELRPEAIEIALFFVLIVTLGNLRGIRESATIFAIPTYFFIFTFGGMLVVGLVRLALGHDLEPPDVENHAVGTGALTVFLLLRGFSSGSAALTGIEAVANGVPSFKPPEAKNAATTQVWMAAILIAFFVGTTYLAYEIGVLPSDEMTVVAQIAQAVFGQGAIFYVIQFATVMILILAANTAFAGLPTLASVMAKDQVMPKQFAFRGDRLAFSNGIIFLGLASAAVLIAFSADTHKIIPLYAFGVFTAFTLSQAGMVVHWRRHKEPGWRSAQIINAVGAVVTGIVAVIIVATKFTHGAWLSIVIMVVVALVLWRIREHYKDAERQLGLGADSAEDMAHRGYTASAATHQSVIIPVDRIDRSVLRTVAFARTISPAAVAVHVTDERVAAEELRKQWEDALPDTRLVIVESPYRSLVEPILAYIEGLDRTRPGGNVIVVLAEFVPKHFWQKFLHNQLSQRLKKALIDRPNTVVVDVRYHFDH